MNAYACSPDMGSEPGMAWNWCLNLAEYCELHIITEGEFRGKIEAALPTLPQGKNMHFYYNPVSDKVRKMCWNQGDWRFYWFYKKWQQKTFQLALEIMRTNKIDIVHQLNMIGFREPGYLWKIEGVPFVWGPVDAKEKFPVGYLKGAGLRTKIFVRIKNLLTVIQLRRSKRVNKAIKRASIVISATTESRNSFKKYFNIDSPLLNETGCYPLKTVLKEENLTGVFNVLWVGKGDFRKRLDLAVRVISKMNNKSVKLHIAGISDTVNCEELAMRLGISSQYICHGIISHKDVIGLMQYSDLFLFTSVAEGTPHVVLEAIQNNLPVVCFDTCGQGDCVNEAVGIKIPLSNPEQSVSDFADKISYLYHHREVLKQLSANCSERQEELSWKNKARQMVGLYEKALAGFQSADAE